MQSVIIQVFMFFVGLTSMMEVVNSQEILKNRQIYTFQNKADFGFNDSPRGFSFNCPNYPRFLTSIGKSKSVVTDVWRDVGSQKWRVFKGYVSSSYMLKPTSEESQSIYVNGHFVEKASSGFGFSSSQYWALYPADRDFYQIRNLKTEECLESHGIGKGVRTSPCRNSIEQQWAMHSR